jgi:hypothetical protein
MTEFETWILVASLLCIIAVVIYHKLHHAEKRFDALLKQEKERLIEEQRQARIQHREQRLAEFKATAALKMSSGSSYSSRDSSSSNS